MLKEKFILYLWSLLLLTFTVASCQSTVDKPGANGGKLSVEVFDKYLLSDTDAQIIDVRTPNEYSSGHLKNALNMDIHDDELFEKHILALDKTKPTYVYCLSGVRSAKAADFMREHGFAKVYDMHGGILKWNQANKPIEAGTTEKPGMSTNEFNKLVTSDKIVVVDFFATWCAPCKKISPMLEELSFEMKDKIQLVKINVDENKIIVSSEDIDAIPVIIIYKNGKEVWRHDGPVEKEALESAINKS